MSKVARSVSRAGASGRSPRRKWRTDQAGKFARRVIVKARIVRSTATSANALRAHLRYISRDSAVRGDDQGRVFEHLDDDVDRDQFADATKGDRHHFRFIVSPEDGGELRDMKPFVRDLVSQMERDLETRLDWVAAIHDNTDHPHAHIVVRGKREDGRDLVMPRAYISHTIRERAEELVTLELGPESKLERDVKHAKQVRTERLTRIDRTLARMSDQEGVIDLARTPMRYRAVNAARLRKLKSLGLADKIDPQRWKVSQGFQRTLKDLGERGDIIKQMHRALGDRRDRVVDPVRPFFGSAGQVPLTGELIRKTIGGDGHDVPYVIVDGLDGRVVHCRVANAQDIEGVSPGMIVTLQPPNLEPRPSDENIAAIASDFDGIYSAALHHQSDPRSTPEFIREHIRRLEALRRQGLVERLQTGEWRIPQNYLSKVRQYHEQSVGRSGAILQVESWSNLEGQTKAIGATWLDTAPVVASDGCGFAEHVRDAIQKRRNLLQSRGVLSANESKLSKSSIEGLKRAGFDHHGQAVAQQLGKTYRPLPRSGSIEGIYVKSIKTPEGRFAVIDRGNTVSLAPWRRVMERAKGQEISGVVRIDHVSWQIGRKKGLGR